MNRYIDITHGDSGAKLFVDNFSVSRVSDAPGEKPFWLVSFDYTGRLSASSIDNIIYETAFDSGTCRYSFVDLTPRSVAQNSFSFQAPTLKTQLIHARACRE